ncbi:MAG: MG2 domain-containing protein, partial [Chthoniobacteraceae bacterium]
LTTADGAPLQEKLDRTLVTPPFANTMLETGANSGGIIPPRLTVRMAFNLAMNLASAENKFRFVGEDGKTVAAEVRYATKRDYFHLRLDQGDWLARWSGLDPSAPNESEDGLGDDEDQAADAKVFRDHLVITPAHVLTSGAPWRLEIAPGLESIDGGHRLEGRVIGLGSVSPFTVTTVTPSSYINSGRSVTVHFSDRLGPDVDDTTFTKFFRITPAVPDLKFEEGYEEITLRGKFERDLEYTLTLDPTLLSGESLPISGELARRFRFEPVKPRVYVPAFTGHQIAEGRRTFEVTSANLSALRVTALLVDPAALPQAVNAFKDYRRQEDGANDPDEPNQARPVGAVKGCVIYEKTIALPDAILDTPQRTTLHWTDILGDRKMGGVLLTIEGEPMPEAGGKMPAAQTLIQLTDIGVLWKQTDEALRLHLFSMGTGQPIAGARATVLDSDFKVTAEIVTDAEGAAAVAPDEKVAWLQVQKGNDAYAMRIGRDEELPMSAFGLPIYYDSWNPGASTRELRGLIFTDRPLYQPGETVRVKGIVRRVEASGLAFEAGTPGILVLYWPQRDQRKEIAIRTDGHGAFDAALALDSTTVGRFYVSVRLGGLSTRFRADFQVGEFQPNAFEVSLEMPPRFAPDQAVTAEVLGKYFFGSPIAGAKLQWTLQSRPTWFEPPGFYAFTFGLSNRPEQKTLTLRGEAELDGTVKISPRLPSPENTPQEGVVTVDVTDVNQQTVAATRTFVHDASEFYLGLAIGDADVVTAGEDLVGSVVAVTPDGQPLGRDFPIAVELIRLDNRTVRVMGAGGAVSFSSDVHEVSVAKANGRTVHPVRRDDVWKAPGDESFRVKAERAGSYRIEVMASDSSGREVKSSRQIYVAGKDRVTWDYRHPSQVDLKPDHRSYVAGDTAKVLVKSPFAGDALVSVEREGTILRQWKTRLEGNAPVIEIPIEKSDAPNVFVSMMLIRGTEESTRKFKIPEYRYGVCELAVDRPDVKLTVAIEPARQEVQPGDEAVSVVRVTGADGNPVPDADVTFYAIDDGILALTGFDRPDPLTVMNAPYSLRIRTGISLMDLMPEDPADLEFGNKGYLIGGGGLEGPGPAIRTNFSGTAVWLPSLRTGADGTVAARFTAPDALTRYRLVAVVSAGTDRFGSAESAVAIRKPLMLLPALGSIAHVGDQLMARAVLRNETGADGMARIFLQLDATAAAAGAPLEVEFPLKHGAAHTVDFPVQIREMGEGRWIWSSAIEAGGKVFQDRLETKIRIGSPAPVLREIYLSELGQKTNDLLAGVNPQVLEGEGAMTVTLSNTRLASLRAAADALLTYPYGCAEQLVSGLAPWLAAADLRPILPVAVGQREDWEKSVRTSIEKIMALQTESGGLTYWPTSARAELFPTAWAVVVLSRAERNGL